MNIAKYLKWFAVAELVFKHGKELVTAVRDLLDDGKFNGSVGKGNGINLN